MSAVTLTSLVEFIESVFGSGHLSRNNNFDVRCPVCAPLDPNKKKLSILLPETRVHCWVCGYKSRTIAPLVKKYGTQTQLLKYKEMFDVSIDKNELVTGEREAPQDVVLPKDFKLLTLAPECDPDVKAVWRYIFSRGLDERDAWYYKFGVSNEHRWRRRVIMPSFDASGKLNYFTARAVDPGRRPKYDNPDVDKNPIVFNEINVSWNKRLVLVEGPFDLVKCPENSVALLGSDLDERHELLNKIVLNNTPVALALDGDMWAGKTPKIVKKLTEYDVDVVVVDVRHWGDPGKMSKSEFETALSEASRPTWEDDFARRLEEAISFNLCL